MIIVRGGIKNWLEEQIANAQASLNAFVKKLHDDDGNIVAPHIASFAFEWSSSEIVMTAESKVYADLLTSYNGAIEKGKTDDEWLKKIQTHAMDRLMNQTQYIAGSKSTSMTGNLVKEAEVQAWAKFVDACKWAEIEIAEKEQ